MNLKQLRCILGWHQWQYGLKGIQSQGQVYPVQQRVCKRCQLRQRQHYLSQTSDAQWIDLSPEQVADDQAHPL